MTPQSLTEQLAAWLVSWRESGIPDDELAHAQYYTLDWLGSAIAGTATPAGKMLLDYAHLQPNTGTSRLVGNANCVSAEVAALVNGGLSHIVEMDDLDRASVVHPATVVIPAALAVAEREGSSGRDFLAAVVAGYEVAIRIGEAIGAKHYFYFHNTATCGTFGAAAAAGYLLGLNEEQLVWALGNAGTMTAGLWEFNRDGAMSKHLHAGQSASNGVRAADLAARGFTGTRYILEGERGLFAATAPDALPEKVVENLHRETFKIGGVSIKPHASCRHTHAPIDAILTLRDNLDLSQIAHIDVDTYPSTINICDNPSPNSPYAAKFSVHYCVASALQHGSAGLLDFDPSLLDDPDLVSLMNRTTLHLDEDFKQRFPAEWNTRVRVTLTNGETRVASISHPKGDPENALSWDELETKFHGMTVYAGREDLSAESITWIKGLNSDGVLGN